LIVHHQIHIYPSGKTILNIRRNTRPSNMGEVKKIPFVPLEQRPPMSYDPYNPFQVEAILAHFNGTGPGSSAGAGCAIGNDDDRESAEMEMVSPAIFLNFSVTYINKAGRR
jgi:hypothetical protein